MSHLEYWTDEFASWKDDDTRRAAFLAKLIAVGRKWTQRVFVSTVVLSDYRTADARYPLTETFGGPYAVAQLACFVRSIDWLAVGADEREPHQFVCNVERGDVGQDKLLAVMDAMELSVADLPKRSPSGQRYRPFEWADLLAYEFRRVHAYRIEKGRWDTTVRDSYREVRTTLQCDVGAVDATIVDAWVRQGLIKPLTPEQLAARAAASKPSRRQKRLKRQGRK